MRILGISAFYHDSAAALLQDGKIVAAAQEERFTRKKFDASFPEKAISYCLSSAGCQLKDVDYIAFYDKPLRKFNRLLSTYLAFAPEGFWSFRRAMPLWLRGKVFQKQTLTRELRRLDPDFDARKRILFAEHHQSHAASAFYPSPFREAVVLTMDGVGEWATTSVAIGRDSTLSVEKEIRFPHSLGLLYSAVTQYLGFKVLSGEYKIMGLAPYGEPRFASVMMDKLIHVCDDGSFHVDQSYFDYCTGLQMSNDRFADLFGRPARRPEQDLLEPFHMDIAASVQAVTETIVLRLTRSIAAEYGIRNLTLAGGVALNCVANGKVAKDGAFERIWIQPASGDAGGAVGAALAAYHQHCGKERHLNGHDAMQGSYLGPAFDQSEIEGRLSQAGAVFDVLADDHEVVERTAEALENEHAVGWFQGRMEFGPRALGGRSILGDARSPGMQRVLNLKVKYRESFRPFAPSILRENLADWFDLDEDSPYMLLVAPVREDRRRDMTPEEQALFGIDKLNVVRSEIPAVTHVDYSARIQTVHQDTNPLYHELLRRFNSRTGCPVLVNTSFNVRGEPIVCTPEDAFRCFMGTELDALAIGRCYLKKSDQKSEYLVKYKDEFELD